MVRIASDESARRGRFVFVFDTEPPVTRCPITWGSGCLTVKGGKHACVGV